MSEPQATEHSKPPSSTSIFSWVWRTNARLALVPLIVVELALVGVYLLSNSASTEANIEAVQGLASEELRRLVRDQAMLLDRQLQTIHQDTELYRRQVRRAYQTPYDPPAEEKERYAFLGDTGMWHTTRDNGGAALYYSGKTQVGAPQQARAWQLAQLDPLMKDIQQSNPLIVQIYLNTWDSMNRIYPYIEAAGQYPPQMDIPTYNFYYEADLAHNPSRGVVWTEAYVDPAGQGWMSSAIAPVYAPDDQKLEAVVGLDITIQTFVQHVLNLDLPWGSYAMLLDRSGTILALPEPGEEHWGLTELTEHHYSEAIKKDTFKPDEFNVYKRADTQALAQQLKGADMGLSQVSHLGQGRHMVSWATIPETGWKLLVVVPEENIYAQANALGTTFRKLGYGLLGGLLVFYVLFLALLYRRTREHSKRISAPLVAINHMVEDIGRGNYQQAPQRFDIQELTATSQRLANMGQQLAQNQRDLIELRDKALESSQLKSEFMASISHELRTPMNGILGVSELLMEEDLAPEQREMAHTIHSSGASMLRLLEDLLDFSQIDAGHLKLRPERFTPRDWLTEVVELFAPRARSKHLALRARTASGLPEHLLGDATRLRQVLSNLINNALKFTQEGSVDICMQVTRVEGELAWLKVQVKDTGEGIPEHAHERLFMPFTQVDGSQTRQHGGVGLGLSICKKIVETMGGQIGVQSQAGEGSLFWFEVPLELVQEEISLFHEEPPAPADLTQDFTIHHHGQGADHHDPRHSRVLLVDDNPLNLNLLERALKRMPYQLDRAASGKEALELLQRRRYHLLLTDIHMPEMDGVQLTQRVRAMEGEQGGIPIIAITADAYDTTMERFLQHGIDDCITKPYRVQELRELIQRWLPARTQEDASGLL